MRGFVIYSNIYRFYGLVQAYPDLGVSGATCMCNIDVNIYLVIFY